MTPRSATLYKAGPQPVMCQEILRIICEFVDACLVKVNPGSKVQDTIKKTLETD